MTATPLEHIHDEGGAPGADRRERQGDAIRPYGALKAQHAARRSLMERVAERLTRAASSPLFLLVHAVWFAVWLVINSGVSGLRPFDAFPFGLLTLVLSIEAIVLTIFVLMSQGREAMIAELREEMTLQLNLRIEEEVTKTLQLVTGLYARLGVPLGDEPALRDMLRPIDPEAIEAELVAQIESEGREDDRGVPGGETAPATGH